MAKMTNNYVYHTPCLRNSSIFLLHRSKMVISWDVFSIFSKFWFSGLLVGKSAKKAQNNSKFCLSLHISGAILMWLWFLVHMCKRIFFPAFFWFFQIFDIFDICILERARGVKLQKLTIITHFSLSLYLKIKKTKILIKQKQNTGDIITLQVCTKHHNHMRYHYEDMEWETVFLDILGHFFAFLYPLP